MSFEIFTDSSANLTDELIDSFGINIVSLTYLLDGVQHISYVKGEKTELKGFYEQLRQKKSASTSCVNEDAFYETFKPSLAAGKDILYLGFSSALSNTYQFGRLALDRLRAEFPERKIYDCDTLSASMGQGLLVYHACLRRASGEDIETVHKWVEDNKLKLVHWFTVDDLFFLYRGGRVKKLSYYIGSMVNIKPIMHVDNSGRLVPVGKVVGRKRSLSAIVDRVCETIVRPEEQTIFISHGDCPEDVEYVVDKLKERIPFKDVVVNYVDPVIGVHSGPGTFAIFYLGTQR